MKEHLKILKLAAKNQLPEKLDENSELPIEIISELIDAGYINAIDATTLAGPAYLHCNFNDSLYECIFKTQ